ncbi:hypothetical protein T484DRAFT_1842371 [Baffinella frigidus]|nr:hypothetical protein T484DRAFT_1842371 [Cryptophyta sp. CCMP2293]
MALLAIGTNDGWCRVADTRDLSWRMSKGHSRAVRSVAISSDGKALATAGDDKSWRVRDAVSWEQLACGRGHDGTEGCICEQFFLPLTALANPASSLLTTSRGGALKAARAPA